MVKTLLGRFSAFFSDRETDALPDVRSDGKIKFYSSNRRIFNSFFTVITVSTFVAMLAIILFYVFAFAASYNGSSKFDWLLGIFSDFTVIMNFSLEESPYVVGDSSYPPIAIAILYPFALICKDVFSKFEFSELTADELTAEVIVYPEFWIAILLFFFICSALIVLLTSRLFGFQGRDVLKIAVIIMLSAPFIYTVMRGNTIYFALIFLVAFLILKDSKSLVAREFSYIFLALAGAIKIYPLFFGVFLLKDKKLFASVRVGVYFALISVFSFFLFRNDFNNVVPLIDNLSGFMSNEVRLLGTNNLSLSAQLYKLIYFFYPAISPESTLFTVLSFGLMFVVFALGTYSAVATRNNFSRYVICFCVVMLIPTISYFYVIIFSILPFLEYIRTYSELSMKKRVFYFLSFMFLFNALLVIPVNFILHSLIIMSFFVVESVSVIKERRAIRSLKTA